jgi:hypothetical protein
MSRPAKLGAASLSLAVGFFLPSPFGFVCAVISCLLRFLAAQLGSKWWLVVPFSTVTVFALLFYVGFHAR